MHELTTNQKKINAIGEVMPDKTKNINKMKNTQKNNFATLLTFLLGICLLAGLQSCKEDDPVKEDTPEMITKATLTFTPAGGGSAIVATATDPDGEGVKDIEVDGAIALKPNTTYTLAISLVNGLASPSDPAYDVTAEVEEEGDEHLFFFSFTSGIFSNPSGNGNFDTRGDAINYLDADGGGLPIGLETSWTTGAAKNGNTFRVVLKHQPGVKSTTSKSSDGETDLDIEFTLNIQ